MFKCSINLFNWDKNANKYYSNGEATLILNNDGFFKIIKFFDKSIIVSDNFNNKHNILLHGIKYVNNLFDYELLTEDNKFAFKIISGSTNESLYTEYFKIKQYISDISFYSSNKIHIDGYLVDDNYSGKCIEYYDNNLNTIKYIGEFYNGEYHGKGTFYSENGLIKIQFDNLVNGVLKGIGKIFILNQLHKEFNVIDIVNADALDIYNNRFCEKILKELNPTNCVDIIEMAEFRTMDIQTKTEYLLSELQMMRKIII
jgi:hypothetical protein